MDTLMSDFLPHLQLGAPVLSGHVGFVPIFFTGGGGPRYLVLKEAQDKGLLRVTEVDIGGRVPELKVVNDARIPVLILDGEELIGAKQNRVVNTTILLRAKSETVIPVSCTEHGRWEYRTREFVNSDAFAPTQLRAMKNRGVSKSLKQGMGYRSEQSAIWEGIASMNRSVGVKSDTGAMRQMYDDRAKDLDEHLTNLKCQPDQKGMVFFANGKVLGCDFLSQVPAYEQVHPKLTRSYVMDTIIRGNGKGSDINTEDARKFLDEAARYAESKHSSIGHGYDYRYDGMNCAGSALVYRKVVIHTAFFSVTGTDRVEPMAGYGRRRGFRL